MATYEYKCNNGCGEFEVEKSIADIVDVECPRCGVTTKHRLISLGSFVLKGGAWYKDGYHRNKND